MKISLNWLQEYADFPSDVEAVSDALSRLGLPVEDVEHVGGVAGVITARVLRTESHPEAAKVQRVWVDAGDGASDEAVRHVWCGASNFGAGDVTDVLQVANDALDAPAEERIAEEGRVVHDADDAARLGHRPELSVVEVAPMTVHAGNAGVSHGERQRAIVDEDGVPERLGASVREIDEDALFVQSSHELDAARFEPALSEHAERRARRAEPRVRKVNERDAQEQPGRQSIELERRERVGGVIDPTREQR